MLKAGQRVRIATYPLGLPTQWSEKGTIVPHHKSWKGKEHKLPAGYHTVRYDDGGCLMIHETSLMPSND